MNLADQLIPLLESFGKKGFMVLLIPTSTEDSKKATARTMAVPKIGGFGGGE